MKASQGPSIFYLLVIAAVLQIVWGAVPAASKFVINEIPVELYIALRWSISGFIFGVYLFLLRGWKKVSLRDLLAVSTLGILGYGFASLGSLYGLKIGGVTNFALMAALSPIVTSLVAICFLKERPNKFFLFALALSVLGLLTMVVGKYQVSSFSIASTSAAFILGGCFLEALVFVCSKRFKARISTTQYLATSQIAAAIFMWLLQLSLLKQTAELHHLSARGISAAIFVSVVACVLCYAVLYWLLNYIDGHRLALFDGFHAVSATLFGTFFFSEELKPLMFVGGFLILSGLVLGNLPKNPSSSPEK